VVTVQRKQDKPHDMKKRGKERAVAQMGWEQRGNNRYYYKKAREGSRVRSIYVGRGEIANMISQIQSSSAALERLARTNRSPQVVAQEKADAQVLRLTCLTRLITQASLLASGFHTHKRQWRKMRNG
jgi:hypothetical protein